MKYKCPICGQEASFQIHNEGDTANIVCLNPNCLNPKTGWMPTKLCVYKWKKFAAQNKA